MTDQSQNNQIITKKSRSSTFGYIERLASYIELLEREIREAPKVLNEKWAREYHPKWGGIRILSRVVRRTRELESQKTNIGRTQLLIKELKASKVDIVKDNPDLWGMIERSLRLDERGLIVDEDILMTLNELKKRVESGEVIKALEYLNSPEGKGKFEELGRSGETELINDARRLLSDAKRIMYLLEKKIRILDYYYGLISDIELNSSSLNNLIRTIRNMVSYFEQNYPNDKLLKVIKGKRILLHLMEYYIEIQYLEGLLLKVRRGLEEGGWEDFLDFYDQKTKLRRFKEHVKKIGNEFGDFNTANVLENAGNNTKEYGDQPLKWIKLLEFLIYRLNSDWYITALVKVGHKSLSEVIKGEKDRIQDEVKHQLTKQLVKIEGRIANRISKLEDVRPILKSILKEEEKKLVKFLKETRKEFWKKVNEGVAIIENNEDTLKYVPQTSIDNEYKALAIVSNYRKISLQTIVAYISQIKGAIRGIIINPQDPYNFAPIFGLQKGGQYPLKLERVEEPYVKSMRKKINTEIPISTKNSVVTLLQIKKFMEDTLVYLRTRGFTEQRNQRVVITQNRIPTQNVVAEGGESYG